MRVRFLAIAGGMLLLTASAFAQKIKSKAELEAIQKVQAAPDPDSRIAAVDEVLTKFADTEFKPILLQFATQAAEEKGDYAKVVVYGERALEANPDNTVVLIILSRQIARNTRPTDLDRDASLAKADKYGQKALSLIDKTPKPNPAITDEQWAETRKDMFAQAHEALGISAMDARKYDVAMKEFKASLESRDEPAVQVRLADAYLQSNKPDDSIATLDKVLAISGLNPQIRQVALKEKVDAEAVKKGEKKIHNADTGGPGEVQIGK